jgi:magnesium chelatase family protein
VARYRAKLSGPLLDRLDIMIEVPALADSELLGRAGGDSSAIVRARFEAAREIQLQRQGKANALLTPAKVVQYCLLDCDGAQLLKRAIGQLSLSARGYHRILKVARSVADLASEAQIRTSHIAEAVGYRRLLRGA